MLASVLLEAVPVVVIVSICILALVDFYKNGMDE